MNDFMYQINQIWIQNIKLYPIIVKAKGLVIHVDRYQLPSLLRAQS